MLFSDDVRPNKNVSKIQADAICKMAVDASADTEGVVCQSITEHIATKYNLGKSPKLAYGLASIASGEDTLTINFTKAGFSSAPFVVALIKSSSLLSSDECALQLLSVSFGSASFRRPTPSSSNDEIYWMAIGR